MITDKNTLPSFLIEFPIEMPSTCFVLLPFTGHSEIQISALGQNCSKLQVTNGNKSSNF